jgi:hypothetical protein
LVDFLQLHVKAGFWKNDYSHRRVSERWNTPYLKRCIGTTGRIFRISDFIEASRNFLFNFIRKKAANIMKTKSAQTKGIDMIFKDLKKIFIS